MPDDPTPAKPEQPPASQGSEKPEATPTPTPTPTPTDPKPGEQPPASPTLGPDGKPWDPERAARTISQQRETERKAKEERDAALAKVKQYEDAELSEKEKLAREAEEARKKAEEAGQREAAAQETIRRGNLLAELSKPEHGIVDARAAAKLIEGVEFAGDGTPTNLGSPDQEGSLLAKFLESHSFLRAQSQKPPPPSIDGGSGGEQPQVELTADEVKAAERAGLTPQQFEARKNVKTFEDWQRLRAQERQPQ